IEIDKAEVKSAEIKKEEAKPTEAKKEEAKPVEKKKDSAKDAILFKLGGGKSDKKDSHENLEFGKNN
ncbi:MAG: hypothetical protein IKT78_04835, partial [Ruminiclostridium sp.]|nr:hypothetical protein [Ruminiclostridium sp.]